MGAVLATHGASKRHKSIAYDRLSGGVVGSAADYRAPPVDNNWDQIYDCFQGDPWVRVAHESHRPFIAHAKLARDRVDATSGVLRARLCV